MLKKINYGYDDAEAIFKKLIRERQSIVSAINSQDDQKIADSIFNFSITGLSLKDWLKEELSDKKAIEHFIDSHLILCICVDLANGSKHKIKRRDIRAKDDPISTIESGKFTFDMTTLTWDSLAPLNGLTVRVTLQSGRKIEIMDFANKVIEAWRNFLDESKSDSLIS